MLRSVLYDYSDVHIVLNSKINLRAGGNSNMPRKGVSHNNNTSVRSNITQLTTY